MKKKKRKRECIRGSNEGFSLVELIVVIGIMAILVGIVTLAVVPHLEKSREVKDLRVLDEVCRGLTVAVANISVQTNRGTGTFEVTRVKATASDTVIRGVYEQLGDCSNVKLVSGVGSPCKIMCKYDIFSNTVEVYADDGGDIPQCIYLKNSKGEKAELKVRAIGGNNAGD